MNLHFPQLTTCDRHNVYDVIINRSLLKMIYSQHKTVEDWRQTEKHTYHFYDVIGIICQ